MSLPTSSTNVTPSSYATRAGRTVKAPSYFTPNEPVSSKRKMRPVSKEKVSTKKTVASKRTVKSVRKKKARVEKKETVETSQSYPRNNEHEESDDCSSSVSTLVGYCYACDRPGPQGLMCNADGCEDGNCMYE